jgi:arylformamidase
MQQDRSITGGRVTRRTLLGAAASLAAAPALADCPVGPPPHAKGPLVFMNYDQTELDAAYDQSVYSPLQAEIKERTLANSDAARRRLGAPVREAYGPSEIEKLDIYRARQANAPIFVFIHGGAWLSGASKESGYAAELFHNAGATFVALDFIAAREAGGDIGLMAEQVKRAIAWVHKNAKSFGGDADRLYIGGHSSGGHLCGVALVSDWQTEFSLPADAIKGGLCMSGMYEMKPVRLSKRSSYVTFTDDLEHRMSSQRFIERLKAPIIVTYGTHETPEFQRQNRDFAAAVKQAGKPVELVEAKGYNHFEMGESLGNPYGPNGRAALQLMKLAGA